MIKQIMIPVAAFAVTVTGASAFNGDLLSKLDISLSDTQISALEEAHELRIAGADQGEVKTFLAEAGINQSTMEKIRDAMHKLRDNNRTVIESAVKNNDYDAFLIAVTDTPLADNITSESDFEKFVEAQEFRQSGDYKGAQKIMSELGIERPRDRNGKGGERQGGNEAIRAAVESNNYDTFKKAIFGTPLADVIKSEADFKKIVEVHELRGSGDNEGAKEIMDELGIKQGRKEKSGYRDGFGFRSE